MRSPRRRRPRRRTLEIPPGTNLDALADRVRYVGSPEHKNEPTFAGRPRLRGDASPCPREYNDRDLVSGWLRAAVRAGSTGTPWEGGFPRYVWHREQDTVFEARLVNQGNGTYKGYPLEPDEWPLHLVRQE